MAMLPKCLKDINLLSVILDGTALKWVTEQKHLDVYISNNTADDRDVKRQMRSCNQL